MKDAFQKYKVHGRLVSTALPAKRKSRTDACERRDFLHIAWLCKVSTPPTQRPAPCARKRDITCRSALCAWGQGKVLPANAYMIYPARPSYSPHRKLTIITGAVVFVWGMRCLCGLPHNGRAKGIGDYAMSLARAVILESHVWKHRPTHPAA